MKAGLCKNSYTNCEAGPKHDSSLWREGAKEDALYLKITVNFTGVWNKKYLQLFYNKEYWDLNGQENILHY